MRVLWESEERMRMSPPWPPSPPEGPPRGTNFSRRKAMQPLPPSPALIRMWASSMNIGRGGSSGTILCASAGYFCLVSRAIFVWFRGLFLFGSVDYFCLVSRAIFVCFYGLSLDEFSGRGTGDWWRAARERMGKQIVRIVEYRGHNPRSGRKEALLY